MGAMITIRAMIFLEKLYWVGVFERTDKEGFSAVRHIFGAEPSDAEVYQFVLEHFQELQFGQPKEFTLDIKRMNPKRAQREARKEMEKIKESTKPSTFAQDYMRDELEKNKLEKKRKTRIEKQVQEDRLFALKQDKRKQKRKGR